MSASQTTVEDWVWCIAVHLTPDTAIHRADKVCPFKHRTLLLGPRVTSGS